MNEAFTELQPNSIRPPHKVVIAIYSQNRVQKRKSVDGGLRPTALDQSAAQRKSGSNDSKIDQANNK